MLVSFFWGVSLVKIDYGYFPVLVRVSVWCFLWRPKSVSVVGAPLRVSPPSLRGLDCALSQGWRALIATCSSPLRSIWAGVVSSGDARGENHAFSARVPLSISYISSKDRCCRVSISLLNNIRVITLPTITVQ
jgi:hypothetical protein